MLRQTGQSVACQVRLSRSSCSCQRSLVSRPLLFLSRPRRHIQFHPMQRVTQNWQHHRRTIRTQTNKLTASSSTHGVPAPDFNRSPTTKQHSDPPHGACTGIVTINYMARLNDPGTPALESTVTGASTLAESNLSSQTLPPLLLSYRQLVGQLNWNDRQNGAHRQGGMRIQRRVESSGAPHGSTCRHDLQQCCAQ